MGRTGRPHPPIGFGLWGIGRWSPEAEARTRSAAERAWERGLRWFDTAEVYGGGRSERLLGDLLRAPGRDREPRFLTSKVSWEHLRAGPVRAAVLGSLQRLGLPSIDLYLVHAPDPRVPIRETMTALEALWKEGRIGAIGVSNFDVAQLEAARSALQEAEIVVDQVRYNLFDREDGEAILPYCRAHGIVVEAYTPLLRGLLAGRYLDGESPPAEVRRFTHRWMDDETLPQVVARGRELRALAGRARVPVASLALHWLKRQGVAPVFGASRPEQVDEIVAAWAHAPPDEALAEADRIGRGALDA